MRMGCTLKRPQPPGGRGSFILLQSDPTCSYYEDRCKSFAQDKISIKCRHAHGVQRPQPAVCLDANRTNSAQNLLVSIAVAIFGFSYNFEHVTWFLFFVSVTTSNMLHGFYSSFDTCYMASQTGIGIEIGSKKTLSLVNLFGLETPQRNPKAS